MAVGVVAWVLLEIILLARLDVVVVYSNVVISIRPSLLVLKPDGVTQLVNDCRFLK